MSEVQKIYKIEIDNYIQLWLGLATCFNYYHYYVIVTWTFKHMWSCDIWSNTCRWRPCRRTESISQSAHWSFTPHEASESVSSSSSALSRWRVSWSSEINHHKSINGHWGKSLVLKYQLMPEVSDLKWIYFRGFHGLQWSTQPLPLPSSLDLW